MKNLINQMDGQDKILILYHPHIHQLTPDDRGFLWRNNVAPLLEKVSAQYGIRFYNATEDLKQAFERLGPQAYYDRNDMHFNDLGMQWYAHGISGYLIKNFTLFNQKEASFRRAS